MALQFERRHLVDKLWFHKRPSGKGTVVIISESCILLTTDTGADDKEAILTADSGTDTHCAELTTTTT